MRCRCEYFAQRDDTLPVLSLQIEASTCRRALGKALKQLSELGHSHMVIWQIPESDDPMLEAAHHRSLRNRQLLSDGGECGCFYCLSTFNAGEVTEWVHDGSTALCPRCHIDSVLSGRVDSIVPAFLRRMHEFYFERKIRVDLTDEFAKLMKGEA